MERDEAGRERSVEGRGSALQPLEISVEEVLGGDERGLLAAKDLGFGAGQEVGDGGVVVEAVAELLVDALIHPVLGLLGTPMLEVAVLLDEVGRPSRTPS